jgi:hypothetical protein
VIPGQLDLPFPGLQLPKKAKPKMKISNKTVAKLDGMTVPVHQLRGLLAEADAEAQVSLNFEQGHPREPGSRTRVTITITEHTA